MEKNKSIDGLKPRHSKKVASSVKPSRTKTAKKTTKTNVTSVKSPKTIPVETPNSPETTTSSVEDFLKPVQAFNFDETTGELQASTQPTTTKSSKNMEPKKPHKKLKIVLIIILIIILLLGGAVVGFILWGNDIIAKITGGQGTVFDLITFTEPTYVSLKTGSNGRTNILAFGTSGYNMNGDEGDYVHDGANLPIPLWSSASTKTTVILPCFPSLAILRLLLLVPQLAKSMKFTGATICTATTNRPALKLS